MQNIKTLVKAVGTKLCANKHRLSTAESCTGGLVAKCLTDLAGSSLWFDRGFVTYSNLAKQECLGVSQKTLDSYGAVSIEVASEMDLGALAHSHSQWAIAITGIAGPGGGSKEKPVGTVCFGFACQESLLDAHCLVLEGGRAAIRKASCHYALQTLLSYLEKE